MNEVDKQLAHWCNIAHERVLQAELKKLKVRFTDWESGKLSSIQLCSQIRRFNEEVADEAYRKYVMVGKHLSVLQGALRSGVLIEAELPTELLALIN